MPCSMSDSAYLTIVAHLRKYPGAISGLLLGRSRPFSITHALPLSHSPLTLHTTPAAQLALHLSEAYAAALGLSIVGAYHANEIADDIGISTVPTRLADRVCAVQGTGILLMVKGKFLTPSVRTTQHCFRVCIKEEVGTWGRAERDGGELVISKQALAAADRLLCGDSFAIVADFEEHCENPGRDWLNEGIETCWASLLARASET